MEQTARSWITKCEEFGNDVVDPKTYSKWILCICVYCLSYPLQSDNGAGLWLPWSSENNVVWFLGVLSRISSDNTCWNSITTNKSVSVFEPNKKSCPLNLPNSLPPTHKWSSKHPRIPFKWNSVRVCCHNCLRSCHHF